MPAPEETAQITLEWVAKAESDLTAAAALLRTEDCPTDVVCFHAQQAVEKYLKALLTSLQIEFPKTHNIKKLSQILKHRHDLGLSEEEQDKLTDYATTARYPGFGEITLSEARRAVALARRVRKHVRALLPKGILRRRTH
ncbi:MAG TPA: HEPN domain-containing protein [Bryobacteraceae bacterium]|nr:HEPN domain-containing protein [Bryobacteraceae bacterium]